MQRGDVAAFVERARAAIADAPEMGARNTQLRVVEPLLSLLGWDVRSSSVEAAYVAGDGTVVDYALCPGERPGAFVSVVACEESLSVAGRDDLVAAMRSSNVDRGLYTNGRGYVLVALDGNADGRRRSVEQVRVELDELPEHVAALSVLHHETVAKASSNGRQRFARALVEADESAVDRVTDAVVDAAIDGGWSAANQGGESGVRDDVEPLARRFLDAVVETVAPDTEELPDAANAEESPDAANAEESPDTANAEESPDATNVDASSDGSGPRERQTEAAVSTLGERAATGGDASGDGSEFVVRFFEDGRSVGAVGNPDAASAVAQAVEYLLDERGLGPRLQFPYVPDDGDGGSGGDGVGGVDGGSGGDGETAFLHREPTHPDGRPMSAAIDLGGVYVHTAADLDVLRERVEALAGRSGLQVMFAGDWPDAP